MAESTASLQRAVLQRNNCLLAEGIEAKSVLPYLRDVIDTYQADRIYAEKSSFKQNEKLLSTVSKAGPNGISYFMKALEVCYPNLASQMRQEMRLNVDVVKSCQTYSRPNSGKGLNPSNSFEANHISTDKNKYSLRRDMPVRNIEKEILAKNRMILHKMDANKVVSLCESVNDKYNVEKINAEKTHFQRVEKLLDIIVKLGPEAFEEFINAVNIVNPELGMPIVEELRKHNLINVAQ